MQLLKCLSIAVGILFMLAGAPAMALETTPGSLPSVDGPILITKYSFQGDQIRFIELYNEGNSVVNLDGWKIYVTVGSIESPLINLSGFMAQGSWVTVGNTAIFTNAPTFGFSYTSVPTSTSPTPTRITLRPPAGIYLDQFVAPSINNSTGTSRTPRDEATVPATFGFQRNNSTSTADYLSTFTAVVPSATFQPFDNGLYELIEMTPPQVTEILANPRACSPSDFAALLDCQNYIKLYNPSTEPIDLSSFSLRIGSGSSSTRLELSGIIASQHYQVIPVDVTNSGGWVWLEDVYGLHRYDETTTEYPDASADSKKGQAWAYDESDGTWKWTSQPTPSDAPSVFPLPPPVVPKISTSTLTPCRENQYRSEETNRCRLLTSTTSTLTACREGQYRSEETNRCRSVLSAVAELVPCREGQERNPATNRCRNSILTDVPKTAFAVKPIKEAGKAFVGWWALGGISALALGYAGWEWRRELLAGIHKVGAFFASGK